MLSCPGIVSDHTKSNPRPVGIEQRACFAQRLPTATLPPRFMKCTLHRQQKEQKRTNGQCKTKFNSQTPYVFVASLRKPLLSIEPRNDKQYADSQCPSIPPSLQPTRIAEDKQRIGIENKYFNNREILGRLCRLLVVNKNSNSNARPMSVHKYEGNRWPGAACQLICTACGMWRACTVRGN